MSDNRGISRAALYRRPPQRPVGDATLLWRLGIDKEAAEPAATERLLEVG